MYENQGRNLTTEGKEVKFNKKLCELSVFCKERGVPIKKNLLWKRKDGDNGIKEE